MAIKLGTTEKALYAFFKGKGLNDNGIFGLFGNLYAESGMNPKNLQNSFEKKLGYTDEGYTAAVDNGSYKNFVHDSAGYGLAQWTYWSRKQAMLNFHQGKGASIGDALTQAEFLYKELSEGYRSVLSVLKTAASIREASDAVLLQFERPADQSEAVRKKRAGYGQEYEALYQKEGGNKGMTEAQARQKIVGIMQGWVGLKRSDRSHAPIIDAYNGNKPLPRGYKVTYDDAYCATTTSAAAIKAGYTDIVPVECSCYYLIEKARAMGIWQENDAYIPEPGDEVLYDWEDGANYATTDNQGAPDHVGMVEAVSGGTIKVIEGNMSGGVVGRRNLQVNGRYIRGFICPNYASKATEKAQEKAPEKSVDEIAAEVLAGRWGNGPERRQRLEAAGYSYEAVQAAVNQKAKGGAPAKKSVTAVAQEVLAGKWGNNPARRKALEAAGYDYSAVQAEVNRLCRK